MTPSTADAVRACGGWLFDSVMAGWDVLVLEAEPGDARPMRILGARAVDLEAALTSTARDPRPHVLALAADLYTADARVRALVRWSIGQGLAEVRLWGDCGSARLDGEIDGRIGDVSHRLSVAARAFKAQALAAALGSVCSVAESEVFRGGELVPPPRTPDFTSVV